MSTLLARVLLVCVLLGGAFVVPLPVAAQVTTTPVPAQPTPDITARISSPNPFEDDAPVPEAAEMLRPTVQLASKIGIAVMIPLLLILLVAHRARFRRNQANER